jgi:hypothetical protein
MDKRVMHHSRFPGSILLAAFVLAAVVPAAPAPSGDEGGILMFHGDPARTGWNSAERTLTASTARSLRKLWTVAVEGEIYAEPLVVPGLAMLGRVRTAVYVVTEQNRIYALDAADGQRLWGPVLLGAPVPRASLPCGNIDPVGITSTPVIDRGAGTLYVAGLTTPDGGRSKVYKVAALDVKSGTIRPGWPAEIAPPAASGRRFDSGVQQQRGALLLQRGVLYVPFGGYWGDCGGYHGWVVGIPVASPAKQEAYATPTQRMGGIWAAGGPSADPEGNLYVATGNSDSGGSVDFGNSVLRLATAPALRFSGLARDYFTPSNFLALDETDTDLGSSTPLVLPDQPGSATPHLLFIAGKQGVGYLINRDDMGGLSHGNGIGGEGLYSQCITGTCRGGGPKVFSAVAYWDGGPAGRFIFVPTYGEQPPPCRGSGGIIALRLETPAGARTSNFTVAWCSSSMRRPGSPAVSGSGQDGLVWIVDTQGGVLYALDARTGSEIFASSGQAALGPTHQFITPSVWGGRVYLGAGRMVVAYGLK